jgi:hypothetical protein
MWRLAKSESGFRAAWPRSATFDAVQQVVGSTSQPGTHGSHAFLDQAMQSLA